MTWALLAFAVVGAPLPFGSVEPIAIAFWCVVLGLALVVCSVRELNSNQLLVLGSLALLMVAFIFVIHEQIETKAWFASTNPIWDKTATTLDEPLEKSASISRYQPWFSIGGPLLAFLAIAAGIVCGADRTLARGLLVVVGWAGVVYSFYAIASFLVDPNNLLWREKLAHVGSLTGTFFNRNTAAVFFGVCSIIWLALLLEQLREVLPRRAASLKQALSDTIVNFRGRLVLTTAMLLLCLTAMFLTGSRAGIALSLAAFVLVVSVRYRQMVSGRTRWLSAIVTMLGIGFVLFLIMGGRFSGRIDLEGLADGGRMSAYWSTLRIIGDHPWFGTGLGTYEMAFPAYRPADVSMWGTWNRAHNTLLELASEIGLPLAIAIVTGWIIAFVLLVRAALWNRRGSMASAIGLAVLILGSVHSLVDFSLQIPGFAVLFWAIVGTGLARALRTPSQKAVI